MSGKAPPPLSFPPGEGRQVLVVEDETRLREMLTRAIHEMGFTPTAVSQAESALRQMDARPFDILVVDLNLPGMSGIDFLTQVHARWPTTAAIILTGFGDLESAKHAIRLNVVDFLTKPAPLGELEVALDRARTRRLTAASPEQPRLPDLPPMGPEDEDEADDDESADRAAAALASTDPAACPTPSLEEMEQRHILAVLEKNQGNRNATAEELGISLRKLYYRLGQYQKQGLIP